MPDVELAQWRASRANGDAPVPEPDGRGRQQAVTVEVDQVAVGGAILQHVNEAGGTRCLVRVLQTTLSHDAADPWAAVLGALESHARGSGATTLTIAVSPDLVSVFGRAGFKATMVTMGKRLDPSDSSELQQDRRVAIRSMTDVERQHFAIEVREQLYAGMERAGVVDRSASRPDDLENRIKSLTAETVPDTELLLTGLVDGVPVGRAWATLISRDDGLDFFGNTIDLFPEHRGQGLTKSLIGALRRHMHDLGVRDVHLRMYGHDQHGQRTLLHSGVSVTKVHLRKDLHRTSGFVVAGPN